MKTYLMALVTLIVLGGFALSAAADEEAYGYLALEPYFAYGRFGDVDATIRTPDKTESLDKDATRQHVAAGVKFIVPASERVSIRGLLAYAYEKEEVKGPFSGSGMTGTWQEEASRDGFLGEVSVRYWFGGEAPGN